MVRIVFVLFLSSFLSLALYSKAIGQWGEDEAVCPPHSERGLSAAQYRVAEHVVQAGIMDQAHADQLSASPLNDKGSRDVCHKLNEMMASLNEKVVTKRTGETVPEYSPSYYQVNGYYVVVAEIGPGRVTTGVPVRFAVIYDENMERQDVTGIVPEGVEIP